VAETRLRFPRGTPVVTNWICVRPIEGLVEASVLFRREPRPGEMIALDEFALRAGPDDYDAGAYRVSGTPPKRLAPGTYRPVAAHVRVHEHPSEVVVDLGRYAEEFAIVLFDDSLLAAPTA
jgi:hypothetical protein